MRNLQSFWGSLQRSPIPPSWRGRGSPSRTHPLPYPLPIAPTPSPQLKILDPPLQAIVPIQLVNNDRYQGQLSLIMPPQCASMVGDLTIAVFKFPNPLPSNPPFTLISMPTCIYYYMYNVTLRGAAEETQA